MSNHKILYTYLYFMHQYYFLPMIFLCQIMLFYHGTEIIFQPENISLDNLHPSNNCFFDSVQSIKILWVNSQGDYYRFGLWLWLGEWVEFQNMPKGRHKNVKFGGFDPN